MTSYTRQLVHNLVARRRFPGPNYYEVLRWLHEDLRPANYVEIGVSEGRSLILAAPPTIALGVDPAPKVNHRWRTQTQISPMTSSDFFAQHTLRDFFGADHFSLAFVDGLHHFEQAIDDIFNLERYAEPESVIAVHDTVPLNESTAAREQHTLFHTGDVWKVLPYLRQHRPDLEFATVWTAPSGLTLIRRLQRSRTRSAQETEEVERFRELSWDFYKRHRTEFTETIPNDRDAVRRWLGKSLAAAPAAR